MKQKNDHDKPPHVLIIEARFYPEIADMLVRGACDFLEKEGVSLDVMQVPGVFETPASLAMVLGSEELYNRQLYDGFIILGCVIRGETTHYDYVCSESARGLNQLAMDHALAMGYGILTVENMKQAIERANTSQRNKGGEAAKACVTMMKLQSRFEA